MRTNPLNFFNKNNQSFSNSLDLDGRIAGPEKRKKHVCGGKSYQNAL